LTSNLKKLVKVKKEQNQCKMQFKDLLFFPLFSCAHFLRHSYALMPFYIWKLVPTFIILFYVSIEVKDFPRHIYVSIFWILSSKLPRSICYGPYRIVLCLRRFAHKGDLIIYFFNSATNNFFLLVNVQPCRIFTFTFELTIIISRFVMSSRETIYTNP
jgi:hypothetical protein